MVLQLPFVTFMAATAAPTFTLFADVAVGGRFVLRRLHFHSGNQLLVCGVGASEALLDHIHGEIRCLLLLFPWDQIVGFDDFGYRCV